jgi:hypothetical protein
MILKLLTSPPLKISVPEFCVCTPKLALANTFAEGPIKEGLVPEVLK